MHVLAKHVKSDIGIYAVRESLKIIFESRLNEAVSKVKLSSQICNQAEQLYFKVKTTEDILQKKS